MNIFCHFTISLCLFFIDLVGYFIKMCSGILNSFTSFVLLYFCSLNILQIILFQIVIGFSFLFVYLCAPCTLSHTIQLFPSIQLSMIFIFFITSLSNLKQRKRKRREKCNELKMKGAYECYYIIFIRLLLVTYLLHTWKNVYIIYTSNAHQWYTAHSM